MRYNVSDFFCTQCGQKVFAIPRVGNKRAAGHLKKLFCLQCQKENNCAEVKENDDKYTKEMFLIEFNNGNFSIEGNRINENYKLFIQEVIKNG